MHNLPILLLLRHPAYMYTHTNKKNIRQLLPQRGTLNFISQTCASARWLIDQTPVRQQVKKQVAPCTTLMYNRDRQHITMTHLLFFFLASFFGKMWRSSSKCGAALLCLDRPIRTTTNNNKHILYHVWATIYVPLKYVLLNITVAY